MMVPSISPFPVLLKCGAALGSPLDVGPLLLSYCLRAAEMGVGGGQYLQSYIFFFQDVPLFFPYRLRLTWSFFSFPVLYICCLFTVWQGLVVPLGFWHLNASGIPPKRYIKDGDAECLIDFNTIALLADRYFAVLLDLSTLTWQQSQDVEDFRLLVF